MKQRGLGKGLGALLPDTNSAEELGIQEIRISDIDPNAGQPRQDFDDEKLQQLAQSIKTHGIVQPIIVSKKEDRYVIVAGERRWRAARLIGLKTVPVIIKEYKRKELMEIALIENLQREDLNPLEEAVAIRALMEEHSLTQENVSERIGKSRSAVANILRLLYLPEEIRLLIKEGLLTAGHARNLLSIPDTALQKKLAEKIVHEGLSVRQVEEIVKNLGQEQKPKPSRKKHKMEPQFFELESSLADTLGTRVKIQGTKAKGKIQIDYFNQEDLERIYEKIIEQR